MTAIRAPRLHALLLVSAVAVAGCTDLTETPSSAITPENFFGNEAEVLGGLAGVYAQLRGDGALWGYYNVSEISSDEMIVPTRGPDWFDNGRWLELHRHAWGATSPSGLDDMQRVWVDTYAGIARANVLLDALDRVDIPGEDGIRAELHVLRAFYYYMLMDTFGGVPLATTTEIMPRPRATRTELFDFIETELLTNRLDLPLSRGAADNGRLTRGGADAILANMYLNAGVFRRDAGVSATTYNTCDGVLLQDGRDACVAAVAFADSIFNSGIYQLADTFAQNFRHDNHLSRENILVAKNLNADGLGLNFVMRALHYEQFSPTPWNGFATLAAAYNAFDPDDDRRNIFLIGPQVHMETGQPVCERPGCAAGGAPLVFTDTIGNETNARENEGPRILKWPPDPNHLNEHNSNDFAYFRLGELYLIKAEALNEITPGDPNALVLLNQLRLRAFDPDEPLVGPVTQVMILQERLFELTGEAKRRQDLIRHGRYTAAWQFKAAGGPHLILMPIPQTQIDANPELVQNPGY